MGIRGWQAVLIATWLALAPAAWAADALDPLIAEAEAIRSADPPKFAGKVAALQAHRAGADSRQRDLIDYLTAYASAFRGEIPLAVTQARAVLERSEHADIRFRAGAMIANMHAITRQFTEGLRQLGETLSLLDTVDDPEVRMYGLYAASVLYNQIGQYRLGKEYAERLLAERIPPRSVCMAQLNRLEAIQAIGEERVPDATFQAGIDFCLEQKEIAAANFIRIAMARQWDAEGRRTEAVALLERFLPEIESTTYPRVITEATALLSQWHLDGGRETTAGARARRAITAAGGLLGTQQLAIAHRVLYEIANRNGDTATALREFRAHAEADKAWLNDVKARELAYQIVRQETDQKTQQIALLAQQNQLLELQQRVADERSRSIALVALLLVALLASGAAWAWKSRRVQRSLRRMAETDALTGIDSRHQFTLRGTQAIALGARTGQGAALVMFDLDHFKSVNDRFGHGVGDWVLRRVAEACAELSRPVDCFGRLGGEEFAILLPGFGLQEAVRFAESCRARIEQIDTAASGHLFAVSASFGVTTTALAGDDLDRLVSHADRMLYLAKRGGRNRIGVHGTGIVVRGASTAGEGGEAETESPVATVPVPVALAAVGGVAVS